MLASLVTNGSMRNFVIEKGGIAVIIDAMKNLPTDPSFQSFACNTLQYILQDDSMGCVTELVEKGGGIGALVDIFKHFGGSPTKEAANVLTSACRVIAYLADSYEPVKTVFACSGGVLALIRAMKHPWRRADGIGRSFARGLELLLVSIYSLEFRLIPSFVFYPPVTSVLLTAREILSRDFTMTLPKLNVQSHTLLSTTAATSPVE